ncbi:hypothetical protein Tco_0666212 [Tanacetum coccineum]
MENRENMRMILSSVQNGPLIWPTVTEADGATQTKKYEELSATQKIQVDCDCKATNIVLQGLPLDVYAIVNHHKVSKEIWDRVKLLMQGTKLSLQEKECKLYDEFDMFTFVNGETLYHLPPEWSKFVTDVKLARDLHTANYDQLYSYLEQHEVHANETRLMRLTVSVFNQGDDPIACLNKAMAFLTTIASSRFPSTNNQLRTSSNLRNHTTIQDGRVTVQNVQRRQGQSYAANSYKGNATSLGGNNTRGRDRVEKAILAEAQEAGQILDEEQLAFLTDPCILDGQAVQTTIPNTAAFQTEDLDAYDSDCDDVSNAKAVLVANLSSNGSDVLSEVPHFETSHNDMGYQNSFYLKKAQQIKPTLYDGSVISDKHVAFPMFDDEETLILEELNRLSEDFGKCFVPQQELSNEQAFWLQTSHPNTDQSASSPVKIEAPKELPKILKDIFNVFDKDLLNEVTEVQTVFNQMEVAVQQYFVDKQCFEIHKKELFLKNDRLLQKIMSQDVMICVMNSTTIFDDVNMEMQSSESCVKCLDLDAELLKSQNAYNDL